ncbi:MAG: BolA/IbaG family iron-sulfur metabolism protein [Sinobacterium sp.]|nr:BolA/IbaG family iron-sulfur metabolism protein [Sinobacterium sp.]
MADQAAVEQLKAAFSDAHVEINSDGSHFEVLVVSDDFEGLRAIKKQQMVYAVLNEQIASGAMHAVNMKLFTKAEWAAQ